MKKFNWYSNTYVIDSWKKWKTLTIFWWIHWDEISWIKAIEQFLEKIEKWEIILKFWKLIIVWKCNEEAVKLNIREVEYNLNRLFVKWKKWKSYEEKRSNELMKILDKSDYLLDLHSTSEESIPFIFAENYSLDTVKTFWISHIVTWWDWLDDSIWWSTQSYIDRNGWIWFTYEAGSHLNINATKNAYQMILNFISSFWNIDNKYFKSFWNLEVYNIDDIYVNVSWGFKYEIKNLSNFSKINSGECIWMDGNNKIVSNEDKILFMPKTESIIKKWEEVFFYVTKW